MSRRASDRALRRLVAGLATAGADDVASILGELDARQRSTVEAMLDELSGRSPVSAAVPKPAPAPVARGEWEIDGVSPWLAARLAGAGGDLAAAPVDPFALTPEALKALRAAAEPFRSSPAAATVPPPVNRGRSLFGHVHGALLRGRR